MLKDGQQAKSSSEGSFQEESHGVLDPEMAEEQVEGSGEPAPEPQEQEGSVESEAGRTLVPELPPDIAALAQYMYYRPDKWRGITPLHFLQNYCDYNEVSCSLAPVLLGCWKACSRPRICACADVQVTC
jgi:hypothetical protein